MTGFQIQRFDGTNSALWKLKMHAVLVKNGCAVALLGADKKLLEMAYAGIFASSLGRFGVVQR